MEKLLTYQSSDSSDSEECLQVAESKTMYQANSSLKRKLSHSEDSKEPIKKCRLPVPRAIQTLFAAAEAREESEQSEQSGRLRTFPHERGNWASLVHIQLGGAAEGLRELACSLIGCVTAAPFEHVDDYHVSLSRTLVLRHHCIQPLLQSLRGRIATCKRCHTDLSTVQIYKNDEKTRTFIGLELGANSDTLRSYIQTVDQSLREFSLPEYYEEPSLHVSVAWAAGDVAVSAEEERALEAALVECLDTQPRLAQVAVTQVHLQAGNKLFALPLG